MRGRLVLPLSQFLLEVFPKYCVKFVPKFTHPKPTNQGIGFTDLEDYSWTNTSSSTPTKKDGWKLENIS